MARDGETLISHCQHVCDDCGGCLDHCCECITADLLLREVPWPIPEESEKTP